MDFFDILGITQLVEWGKEVIGIKKPDYYPEEVKPVNVAYRPKNLSEYIGQERAKDLVRINIEKILTIKPVHFLISGTKGCGKSTLANIIGNELGFKVIWHIGGAFTKHALLNFLIKNQQDKEHSYILFIDEIHNLPQELGEYLYPIIEDFILPEGKNSRLKPFIFMGATTEKNILVKRFAPLIDRCGADIILEPYSASDIKQILKQYNERAYQLDMEEEIYDILSNNVRFTPRIALAFFDDFIVCKDVKKVLNIHRVIKNGLTTTDVLILNHFIEVGEKPIGIEALSMIAGVTRADFSYVIEPYLLSQGYMSRTSRGRIITNKGKLLLQEIK
jgi:Holliday junction DNA helicase RuvB